MIVTASQLPRLAKCRGALTMRNITERSDASDYGTSVHRWLEQIPGLLRTGMSLDDAKSEATRIVPGAPSMCAELDLGELPLIGMLAEVAFALDCNTGEGRVVGSGMPRDQYLAEIGPDDIGGIVDGVADDKDILRIYDYKTGHNGAPDDWQQRFYALVASSALGRPEVEASVVRIMGGEIRIYSHWYGASELRTSRDALDVMLDRIAADVASADPELEVGEHCTYCPARRACPAVIDSLVHLGGMASLPMTPSEVGAVYRRIQQAEKVIERMKADIRRLAESEPIPLGDGKALAAVERAGTPALDADAVYDRLASVHGTGIAEIAAPAKRTAAIKTINDAAAQLADAGVYANVTTARRELRAMLEESGAITSERVVQVREVKW